MNVSNKTVSKWENDRGLPDIANLKAIAAFFSLTLDEVLGGVLPDAGTRDETKNDGGECRACGNPVGGDLLGAPQNAILLDTGGAPDGSPPTGSNVAIPSEICKSSIVNCKSSSIPNPESRTPSPESRAPSPIPRTKKRRIIAFSSAAAAVVIAAIIVMLIVLPPLFKRETPPASYRIESVAVQNPLFAEIEIDPLNPGAFENELKAALSVGGTTVQVYGNRMIFDNISSFGVKNPVRYTRNGDRVVFDDAGFNKLASAEFKDGSLRIVAGIYTYVYGIFAL